MCLKMAIVFNINFRLRSKEKVFLDCLWRFKLMIIESIFSSCNDECNITFDLKHIPKYFCFKSYLCDNIKQRIKEQIWYSNSLCEKKNQESSSCWHQRLLYLE